MWSFWIVICFVYFANAQMMIGNRDCGQSTLNPSLLAKAQKLATVPKQTWPWIVPIYRYYNTDRAWRQVCVGTLIDDQWLLTAGNCLVHVHEQVHPHTGTTTRKNFVVTKKSLYRIPTPAQIFNPKAPVNSFPGLEPLKMIPLRFYNGANYSPKDLMLIKLQHKQEWTQFRRPICLTDNRNAFQSLNGKYKCFAAGWGDNMKGTKANWLKIDQQYGPLYAPQSTYCMQEWGFELKGRVPDYHFCFGTGKTRMCGSDKGSPLMCKAKQGWVMVGVVMSDEDNCLDDKKPALMMEVAYHMQEIKKIMDEE